MKKFNRELSGVTTYYAINAVLDDDTKVNATFTMMTDENSASTENELNILESDRPLTDEEKDELDSLAIAEEEAEKAEPRFSK